MIIKRIIFLIDSAAVEEAEICRNELISALSASVPNDLAPVTGPSQNLEYPAFQHCEHYPLHISNQF